MIRNSPYVAATVVYILVYLVNPGAEIHAQTQTGTGTAGDVQTSVVFCNLELEKGWKLGNLSFSSLYSFAVNSDGLVVDLKKIRDDFVPFKSVEECVDRWLIKGVPSGSRFTVQFTWEHKKGWIRQQINGASFTQVMSLPGVGQDRLNEKMSNSAIDKEN